MHNFTLHMLPAFRNLLIIICLFMAMGNVSAAERHGLVLQVSENNPKLWNLVLNIAENTKKYAKEPVDVRVVAFGPGLKMLTMESPLAYKLKKIADMGVTFLACGMTMKKLKLSDADLYPHENVKRVRGAVIEITRLHNAGWTYIRP